jgi:amino acid transporter
VPGSDALTKLTHGRRLPYNTILVTAGMAILVLLLNLGVEKVYATLLSVGVLAWYISYAFPIFSQLILHHKKRYRPGRFNLGRASYIVTLLACLWIVIEVVNVSSLVSELGSHHCGGRSGGRRRRSLPGCSEA